MNNVENRIHNWARAGVFGVGKLIEIENTSDDGKGAHNMSEVMFFRLKSLKEGVMEERSIFVKMQLKDERKAADFSTAVQFANEVAMYRTILPELGAFAIGVALEMLYGHSTDGQDMEQDILVMEDLRADGYKVSCRLFQDYDHVVLAMRKLGEYHGLSYKIKQKSPKRFVELHQMLRSREFKLADGIFHGSLYRGFDRFISNPVAKDAHRKLYEIVINKKGKKMDYPEEPFAVINHGDFNKNNLMYKYDENGKAVSIKFVDFGNSTYAEPAVDISFFLYLNTTDEMRRRHWDDFLEVYWEGIISICDPVFNKEQFIKHFAKRAIWGYIPCCFFLPLMMFPDVLKEKEFYSSKQSCFEEKRMFGLTCGGEEATAAVSSIVGHLLDMGYLEEFAYNF